MGSIFSLDPGNIKKSTCLENHNLKRYRHPNVHCRIIYNSQDTKVT